MHELSDPVVALEGVSFGYRAGVRVLEDVSLAVAPGEFVAIAGPNVASAASYGSVPARARE